MNYRMLAILGAIFLLVNCGEDLAVDTGGSQEVVTDGGATTDPGETDESGTNDGGGDDQADPSNQEELVQVDADGDGFPEAEDCDDNDPNRNPGMPDEFGNGVDTNCAPDRVLCDTDNIHGWGYRVTIEMTAVDTYRVFARHNEGGTPDGECVEEVTEKTGPYACPTWTPDPCSHSIGTKGFRVITMESRPMQFILQSCAAHQDPQPWGGFYSYVDTSGGYSHRQCIVGD